MIAARPSHVFESIEELEKKVLNASEPMLVCFHKVSRSLSYDHDTLSILSIHSSNRAVYLQTAEALKSGQPWPVVKRGVAKDLSALLCTYLRAFKVRTNTSSLFALQCFDMLMISCKVFSIL
jgi:hypothetical protein